MTSLLRASVPGFGVGLQVLCAWYGENTSIALLGMRVTGAAAAGKTETVSAPSKPSRTARDGRRAERRDTGRDPHQRRQEGTRRRPGFEQEVEQEESAGCDALAPFFGAGVGRSEQGQGS